MPRVSYNVITAEIKELNNHLKKLEAIVAVTKNVKSLLIDHLVVTEAMLGKCPVLVTRMPRGSGKLPQ